VVSKSGGTAETRNGMLEAQAAFAAAGLDSPPTPSPSPARLAARPPGRSPWLAQTVSHGRLDRRAHLGDERRRPVARGIAQGIDIDAFLAGARAMDNQPPATPNRRTTPPCAWPSCGTHAGGGRGTKDMVVLPYKDRSSCSRNTSSSW
jgi:glucose-6-phosphate isomerase